MKKYFINNSKYKFLKEMISKLFIILCIVFGITACDDDDNKEEVTVVTCEQVTIQNGTTPFSDNFESYETFATPTANWTNVIELGFREFIVIAHEENNFVEMSSFNSNESNKAWLISSKYDIDSMSEKKMSFTIADALNNGNPFKLMYSSNYDGTGCPSDSPFTWTEIGASQIENLINNSENDDFVFESTGDIDISSISGSVVFAFVYEGSETGIVTKIQIDDVLIGISIAAAANTPPTASVNITGTPSSGEVLTADTSSSTDVNGDTLTFTYQWYLATDDTGTGETLITGETTSTYTVVDTDEDKYISVKVIANDEFSTSSEVTATYILIIPVGVNTPPVASVTITGSATLGSVFTADTSASSDIDGDSLTYTYQWYQANNISGTGETAIAGETTSTYTITTADFGKFISVKVIANDGEDNSDEVTATYIYIPYSKKIFITELADPENDTRGRFVELFNSGSQAIELDGWKLIRYTNNGTTPSAEEHHLVGTIDANSTFVIGKISDSSTATTDFISIYGMEPDQVADPHSDGTINKVVTPIDSNGDDQILLIAPDGTTMDIFGIIGEDGSGTAHEFEDGKAVRKLSVTESNPIWNSNEWDIWNDTGAAGTTNDPQIAPGDFTPGIR